MQFFDQKRNKGYTLLFAVIVSAVVLSVAAFIVSVSRKQFILASTARDSMVAIYAADSGIQCAAEAYWEGLLATSSPPVRLTCNGADVVSNYLGENVGVLTGLENLIQISSIYPFYQTPALKFALPNKTCVAITVTDGYANNFTHLTVIESRGYNIGDGTTCPEINPRSIERSVRLVYRGG